ncbi:MAG: porin [Alsobacter sp.]
MRTTVLLGAGFLSFLSGGVLAADLPARKANPVDYVRQCSLGSFTGFVIPGTDVCLKIGGFVRYQYTYVQPVHTFYYKSGAGGYGGVNGFNVSTGGQTAVASAQFDARVRTEYGLLRSFADVRVDSSGAAQIDKAYIQFGPWSFGKFQSFFDFYADAYSNITGLGSDNTVTGAAYSFKFSDTLFLTLAIEDRANALSPSNSFAAPGGIGAPTADGVGLASSIGGLTPGGYRMPDAVAQFLYDGGAEGWGSAQLSAAVHQLRVVNDLLDAQQTTRYGWAAQAGVKVNLPMLGAGDGLYVQGAYAQGALSYIGAANNAGGFGTTVPLVQYYDAIAVGPTGSVKLASGYNVLTALDHFWTPTFDTAAWAGYTQVNYPSGVLTGAAFSARDFGVLQVGAQANWVPAAGLKISAAANWYQVYAETLPTDYLGGVKAVGNQAGGLQGQIRIQRDF